jgi:hypothetical protein
MKQSTNALPEKLFGKLGCFDCCRLFFFGKSEKPFALKQLEAGYHAVSYWKGHLQLLVSV